MPLAAYSVAREAGVSNDAIIKGFQQFQGVGRRSQMRGEIDLGKGKALLIDDYGHHPRDGGYNRSDFGLHGPINVW